MKPLYKRLIQQSHKECVCEHDWMFQPNGYCYCSKCGCATSRSKCVWCGEVNEDHKITLGEKVRAMLFCSRECLKKYLEQSDLN